ncbi:hypothetical protein ScPMuIL_010864 [Solemya velum]
MMVLRFQLSTCCILVALVAFVSCQVPYVEKYFDQYLDHFNYMSNGQKTYKQRYLIQDKWWDREAGPIFFYTGNEGDITDFWDNTGFMFDIAPQFGALVLFAEHRYYGKSMPFGNASLQRDNIGLLTIEQALADFVTLLYHVKQDLNATKCPVIAFGGSYGGMLSAWIRFKYPNAIAGSIAASAPIFLLADNINRDFFFADVTKDFQKASAQCADNVRSGFTALAKMAASGPSGLQNISKIFHLCKPLSTQDDYMHMLAWIRNSFTFLAMLDYPYPASFMGDLPANPVNVACDDIGNATDVVSGLAKATELYYNGTAGTLQCFDIFTEYVPCADPTGCGTGPAGISWDYQACTELPTVNGSNGKSDFFPVLPFTPEMRDDYCQKTWGVSPRRDWGAVQFWTENLQAASNIVFSNGDLDPWRDGGVLKTTNPNIQVAIVKGGAHHLDLRGHNAKDPIGVVAVREIEKQFIRKWVNEYYTQ